MENFIILLEKALYLFSEYLWAVYLILSVVFFLNGHILGYKGMRRFKKYNFWHRYVFLSLITGLAFYEFTSYGTLTEQEPYIILNLTLSLLSFIILKYVLSKNLQKLDGKTVLVIICDVSETAVCYRIVYGRKILAQQVCQQKCWGDKEVEIGDSFPAIIKDVKMGETAKMNVHLIK